VARRRASLSEAPIEVVAADTGSVSVLAVEALPGATGLPGRRQSLGAVFWVSAGWVALMILLAVFASFLHLRSPTAQDYSAVSAGPSIHHLLGTDDLGRDLLSRLIYGSRPSLIIGFAPVAIGLVVGGFLGLLAGYKGGVIDGSVNAVAFVILAFPALLAIIVVDEFWNQPPRQLWKLVVMFAVVATPLLFRVLRATTLSFANREFVVAARAMGARTRRILLRELLPNIVPAAVSFALIGVATAIILEGSLAFLGLSVQIPNPSLGNIINEGTSNNLLSTDPFIALWPSLYTFLLLTTLNLMADRLRSYFDVREAKL
jgi:peptide/nickel transport system permease protein